MASEQFLANSNVRPLPVVGLCLGGAGTAGAGTADGRLGFVRGGEGAGAVGVFGMDVTVVLKRPGERICKRRIATRKIPTDHRVTVDDAIAFLNESYGVEVM